MSATRTPRCALPASPTPCAQTCVYAEGGVCSEPRVNKGNGDAVCHTWTNKRLLAALEGGGAPGKTLLEVFAPAAPSLGERLQAALDALSAVGHDIGALEIRVGFVRGWLGRCYRGQKAPSRELVLLLEAWARHPEDVELI